MGRYPAYYLMGREPLPKRFSLTPSSCDIVVLCGISTCFQVLSPLFGSGYSRVTHPCATKIKTEIFISVRLACVRHAASVRPEPGSNSCVQSLFASFRKRSLFLSGLSPDSLSMFTCVFCTIQFSRCVSLSLATALTVYQTSIHLSTHF